MKNLALILAIVFFYGGFPLLFWWLKRSARKQTPRQEGDRLEFRLASRMRWLVGIVVVSLLAFTTMTVAVSLSQGEGRFAPLIPLAVLLALVWSIPRTIILDHDGVHQVRWFFGERTIAWSDVAWVRRGWRTGTTYIKSRNGGRPIPFYSLMTGQGQFLHEVRRRAGEAVDIEDD